MAEDKDVVLMELITSKADVEDMLKSDPNNPEFLQVRNYVVLLCKVLCVLLFCT